MKRFRWLLALFVALSAALLPVASVFAHPLGNFTINRYAGLYVQPDALVLDYVLDMAEIPAYQEIKEVIDTNHDGATDADENRIYRQRKCADLLGGLDLRVNDAAQSLSVTDTALEFPPGAGGIATLRLTCSYLAALAPLTGTVRVRFADANFAERIGWREITAQGKGVEISGAEVPNASISNRLRDYPTDMLQSPPRQERVEFTVKPAVSVTTLQIAPARQGQTLDRKQDAFAALIASDSTSLPVLVLAILLAIGLGAAHAVSPGHGKTIMAAFLVSTRGTIGQALLLGLTVTVSHTIGVLALGVITLFAAQYVVPERLYPILSLVSGALVIALGLGLIYSRWSRSHRFAAMSALHEHHHPQEHDHDDDHDRDHPHDHTHEHAHTHQDELAHARAHLGDIPEAGLTWKSLLGLGLAGGIVPSTSALILLLSAISLNRIPFGIVLIVAFGLGMAFVLVGVGVLIVRASHFLESRRAPMRLMQAVPLISAVVVVGAGVAVTAQALAQLGIVNALGR